MSDIYQTEDFHTPDVKKSQEVWGLSEGDMQDIGDAYVGQPVVRPVHLTDEALRKGGWKSVKQYKIFSAIRNF